MRRIIFVLILLGFVSCLIYFNYIPIGSSGCGTSTGGMMGSGRNNMMRSGVVMWIIIIILIVIIFDNGSSSKKNKKKRKNLEKLDDRLANGEISIEEYDEIRNKLSN